MEIPKTYRKEILSIDKDCALCEPIPALSPYFFEVVAKHRRKMLKWSSFAATIKTQSDAANWIKEIHLFNHGRQKFNTIIFWKEQFAGMLALHRIDKQNKRAEIGYWVNHDFQGNGLIGKAMRPFLKHAFANYDINRIDLIVGVENKRSIAVAEKAGFIKEGLLRQYFIINGRIHDVLIYRLLKEEFKSLMK